MLGPEEAFIFNWGRGTSETNRKTCFSLTSAFCGKVSSKQKTLGHESCAELWKVPGLPPPHLPGSSSTHLGEAQGGERMLPSKVLPAGKAQASLVDVQAADQYRCRGSLAPPCAPPASIHAKGPCLDEGKEGWEFTDSQACTLPVAGSPSTACPPYLCSTRKEVIQKRGHTQPPCEPGTREDGDGTGGVGRDPCCPFTDSS